MLVKPCGKLSVRRPVPEKALLPMLCKPARTFTQRSFEQPENMLLPICPSCRAGSSTYSRFEQPENMEFVVAEPNCLLSSVRKYTHFRLVQLRNASVLMSITGSIDSLKPQPDRVGSSAGTTRCTGSFFRPVMTTP